MDEARLDVLLAESLAIAVKTDAVAIKDLSKIIVGTTLLAKAITVPTLHAFMPSCENPEPASLSCVARYITASSVAVAPGNSPRMRPSRMT